MRAKAISRAVVAGAVMLAACGSPSPASNAGTSGTGSSTAGTSTAGAGGTSVNTGGSSATGGSAGQANGGGGAGGAASPTHWGQVMLQSLLSGTSRVAVSARFQSGTEPGTESKCTRVTEGPCVASVCDQAPAGSAGAKVIYESAGTVTLTSTEVTGTATLAPDATNQYPSLSAPPFEKEFLGGEHLQIKATGATVPAFMDEISVPFVLLLSQPLFVKGQTSVEAPRAQDLSLVWTRGVKDVFLYLTAGSQRADGMPGNAYLTCQIPSETGNAIIKSSVLQLLAADSQLSLLTIGAKVVTAGDYSVTLATTMPAANPDKDLIPRITLK